MIRRDVPRSSDNEGADQPTHWLLISQVEHARLSHQLAASWRDLLPGAPEGVRDEFLAAVRRHDDGWLDWQREPGIDPEHGRPYGFTEMPPHEAQAIWSKSINACRRIGPLAGWVVASHFVGLQSKQDDDFVDWAPWIDALEGSRAAWLAEWCSEDLRKTEALARECLHLLQVFDWLSLWICCRAPVQGGDALETLQLGEADRGFGPFNLRSSLPDDAGGELTMMPWPFREKRIDIRLSAASTPVATYPSWSMMPHKPTGLRWRIVPGT